MNLRNLTWQEVVICTVLVGATFGAFKFLGESAGAAMIAFTSIVNLALGRPDTNTSEPSK